MIATWSAFLGAWRLLGELLVDGHPAECPLCAGDDIEGIKNGERAIDVEYDSDGGIGRCACCGADVIAHYTCRGPSHEVHERWKPAGYPMIGPAVPAAVRALHGDYRTRQAFIDAAWDWDGGRPHA